MAQAGIHSMVGMAVRKWTPDREWLMLGIVLGNLLLDADNLAVAVATLTGRSTEGLHRTFTHSLFTVAAVIIVFYAVAWATNRPRWGNLRSNVTPPEWWSKLMLPAEFLFFALFFVLLDVTARRRDTDAGFLRPLRMWIGVQGVLFVIFTVLVYTMEKGFMTPFGALYLLSLGLAFGVTLRMRETVEAIVQ